MPGGIYFNTAAFSISVWIYPMNISYWARIIDFGNGAFSNNVVFAIGSPSNIPAFQLCIPSSCSLTLYSSQNLTLSEWQFVAVTYDGYNARIYINSIQTGTKTYIYTMPSIKRKAI